MTKYIIFGVIALIGILPAQAQVSNIEIQAYREYADIVPPSIVVPTVVEVPVSDGYVLSGQYLVIEATTQTPVQSDFIEIATVLPEPYTVSVNGAPRDSLTDKDRQTTGERFEVSSIDQGRVFFDITMPRPITASKIAFVFDQNVALPTEIEVSAIDQFGNTAIVHRRSPFQSTELRFIPTVAQRFFVTVFHAQPLKVNEVIITDDTIETSIRRGVRFLAQPNVSYRMYRYADRYTQGWMGAQANLQSSEGVLPLPPVGWSHNSVYRPADTDDDGIPDTRDNCVSVSNTDQRDINGNRKGDVCEDYDRDGYMNNVDNCPNLANMQDDTDGDGQGDECDAEESRFTERLPWVPWVGMGIAGIILLGLFIFVAIDMRNKRPTVP